MSKNIKIDERKVVNLWKAAIVASFIPLTVICTGLQIYFANSSELGLPFSSVMLAAGIYFVLSVTLLFGLQWLFRKNEKRLTLVNLLLFAFGVMLDIQANVFNWNLGALDGNELNFEPFRFQINFLEPLVWIGIFPAVILLRKIIGHLTVHLTCVIIAAQVFAVLLPQGSATLKLETDKEKIPHNFYEYELSFKDFFEYSGKNDVYLLILDAFGSHVFENVIQDLPDYTNTTLKDFTFFPQCRGQHGTTPFAIPTILTGERAKDTDEEPMNLDEHYRKAFSRPYQLIDTLSANGYVCRAYSWQPTTLYWKSDTVANIRSTTQTPSVSELWRLTVFRLFPTAPKQSTSVRRFLIGFRGGEAPPSIQKIPDTSIPLATPPSDRAIYQFMVEETWKHSASKQFKYLHLQGIHTPFNMDENGNQKHTSRKHSLQGIRSVAKGNLKYLASFIEKMKQSGAYENSLIVIMADHGINTLGTKYQPLLLVKRPNDQYETMQISDAPVHIADTTPAVLTELGLDRPKDAFSWFDIPQDILAQRKTEWNEFWKKHNIPQETTITKKLLHAEK